MRSRIALWLPLFETDTTQDISYCSPVLAAGQVLTPYESAATAFDYLTYAIDDLRETTDRALVNAIGNSKRAIHLAVDETLHQYGLLAQNRKLAFPSKLELLSTAGIISLKILRRLNVERNLVEHEYKVPTHSAVEESIDIARLLILAFGRLTERVVVEWVMGTRRPHRHLLARLNQADGSIDFYRLAASAGRLPTRRTDGVSHAFGHIRNPMTLTWNDQFLISKAPIYSVGLTAKNPREWLRYMEYVLRMQQVNASPSSESQRADGMSTLGLFAVVPNEFASNWVAALGHYLEHGRAVRDSGSDDDDSE